LQLSIDADLYYRCSTPCDILLQIEVAETPDQKIAEAKLDLSPEQILSRKTADDGIGERIWLRVEDDFKCRYTAVINLARSSRQLSGLEQTPLHAVESGAVKYLLPSRYCHLEKFDMSQSDQFADLQGGDLVNAVSDWIMNEFTYLAGASNALTTAHDTLLSRQGVCRDYAHVLIAMMRNYGIPARIVSGYSPTVSPPDFHAVVEVYLEGQWHLVDPTGMAEANEIAVIGVGRDAADISFMTSFGYMDLQSQTVKVTKLA